MLVFILVSHLASKFSYPGGTEPLARRVTCTIQVIERPGRISTIEEKLVGSRNINLATHGSVSTPDLQIGNEICTSHKGLFADPPACIYRWKYTVAAFGSKYGRSVSTNRSTQVVLVAEVVVSPNKLGYQRAGSIIPGRSAQQIRSCGDCPVGESFGKISGTRGINSTSHACLGSLVSGYSQYVVVTQLAGKGKCIGPGPCSTKTALFAIGRCGPVF